MREKQVSHHFEQSEEVVVSLRVDQCGLGSTCMWPLQRRSSDCSQTLNLFPKMCCHGSLCSEPLEVKSAVLFLYLVPTIN